jgi:hypothetical protein
MTNLFDEIVAFIHDLKYKTLFESIQESDRLLWLGILLIIFSLMLIPIIINK